MSEEKKKPIRANGKHIVIVVQSSFPVYTIPTTPPGPAGTGMPYLKKRLTHESSNGLCCVYITLEGNKINPEDQAQWSSFFQDRAFSKRRVDSMDSVCSEE